MEENNRLNENGEQHAFINEQSTMQRHSRIPKDERSTSKQIFLGLITYLTSIGPSMSLGFSAIAIPPLLDENNPYKLDLSQTSWVASIASVATPIGCFLSGPVADKYGRKATLLLIDVVTFVGWLVIITAYYVPEHQYSILLIGRLITGLSTGLASMPPAVYMAEVSSLKLRGVFTTASAIFFALGIMIVYILGYIFLENWGAVAMTTAAIPTVAFILGLAFLQESPTWLVSKGKVQTARHNMTSIFGFKEPNAEVDREMETLLKNINKTKKKTQPSSFSNSLRKKCNLMKHPTFYKPFFILIGFFFFMQFSGIFVVVFYALNIVKDAGVTYNEYIVSILVAATRVITAGCVSMVSKKIGRRPLAVVSGIGMTICMVLLGLYIFLVKKNHVTVEFSATYNWIPALILIVYFFVSTIGFLTVPFALNAELFPTKVRGLGSGLTTCWMYIFSFVAVKTYPSMVIAMSPYGVFWFYAAMSLLGTIFVAVFLPETKGKTLQQIEEMFFKPPVEENLLSINDRRVVVENDE